MDWKKHKPVCVPFDKQPDEMKMAVSFATAYGESFLFLALAIIRNAPREGASEMEKLMDWAEASRSYALSISLRWTESDQSKKVISANAHEKLEVVGIGKIALDRLSECRQPKLQPAPD